MNILRYLGTGAALAALAGGFVLYDAHAAHGSDHQDSNTVIARTGADITDVYLFPAGDNPNNVVLAMDVHPFIPSGMGPSSAFDPAVLYQIKIQHGMTAGTPEDMVIQFYPQGSGSTQTVNVYGPAAPATTGTTNSLIAQAGSVPLNTVTTLPNGVKVFAGARSDPFFFDLQQYFKYNPDRNYINHQPGATVPPQTSQSFNGFTAAYNTMHGTNCNTTPSSNFLASNNFNVLSLVVEAPKSLIAPAGGSQVIHVWATASTTTGT